MELLLCFRSSGSTEKPYNVPSSCSSPLHTLESVSLSVVGAAGLSTHFISPPLPSPLSHSSSSLTSSLFQIALVEDKRVSGRFIVLQTEEQVPEVDACDALPRGSGARRPRPPRRRGACSWSLQGETERHSGSLPLERACAWMHLYSHIFYTFKSKLIMLTKKEKPGFQHVQADKYKGINLETPRCLANVQQRLLVSIVAGHEC